MKNGVETLYHGTSLLRSSAVRGGQDLFGRDDPHDPGLSGTLTKSLRSAYHWARIRAGLDTNIPVVLEFKIPQELLQNNGQMSGLGSKDISYSTKLTADPMELPDEYLYMCHLHRFVAIKHVQDGIARFFRVPRKFLVGMLTQELDNE